MRLSEAGIAETGFPGHLGQGAHQIGQPLGIPVVVAHVAFIAQHRDLGRRPQRFERPLEDILEPVRQRTRAVERVGGRQESRQVLRQPRRQSR